MLVQNESRQRTEGQKQEGGFGGKPFYKELELKKWNFRSGAYQILLKLCKAIF
jgi:hypothetical protein